jgi:ATP synthase protein I
MVQGIKKEDKGQKREFMRFIGVASTIGINLVASTFVGFAIGYWLIDGHLGTFPWFTILFTLLGIVSGFRYIFRIAKRADKEGQKG